MAEDGVAPRRMAVALLDRVLEDGLTLDEASEAVADARLDPAGRARARRLALSVLRHIDGADARLKPHLRKSPPLSVQNALRLGVVEVAVLGAAPHGVVHAMVGVVRKLRGGGRMSGLANAVLRKSVGEPGAGLPPAHMPAWIARPIKAAWGKSGLRAIEAAHAAPPPTDLSVRPGMAATCAKALEAQVLPTGSLRLNAPGQITALAGYDAGDWWVQDAAAALPAICLSPAPGARVLDLCAAPGGKTLQLAAMGAEVTALDISAKRMRRLEENLARTGLQAQTVVADALTYEADAPCEGVLLDAPCSATGTIRRHPELPRIRDGRHLDELTDLQARLLDRAAALTAPGGRLVYAVCSLLPQEGEAQIAAFLDRHPGVWQVDPTAFDRPGIDPGWQVPEGLRLRPDFWAEQGGMDGFFISVLQSVPTDATKGQDG